MNTPPLETDSIPQPLPPGSLALLLLEEMGASAELAGALADRFKDARFCEGFCILVAQMGFEKARACKEDPSDKADDAPGSGTGKRQPSGFEALSKVADLLADVLKMKLSLEEMALEAKKVELEFQKHEDKLAEQDDSFCLERPKGGLTPEALAEIEETAKLL